MYAWQYTDFVLFYTDIIKRIVKICFKCRWGIIQRVLWLFWFSIQKATRASIARCIRTAYLTPNLGEHVIGEFQKQTGNFSVAVRCLILACKKLHILKLRTCTVMYMNEFSMQTWEIIEQTRPYFSMAPASAVQASEARVSGCPSNVFMLCNGVMNCENCADEDYTTCMAYDCSGSKIF